MTPIPPIPEDLQEAYADCLKRQKDPGIFMYPWGTLVRAIERIAKLTAEVEQFCDVAQEIIRIDDEGDTPRWDYWATKLRETLASRATRTPPQEGQ